jgi:DMSO/TMAO reductase YedYZ molybdopterin-dependent catalytic subunit
LAVEPRRRSLSTFWNGFVAGLLALAFNFLLRLGGVAPFPPEAAINAFISIVPASIEEPAVQSLGDLAGELGLFVATLIAALVYGVLLVLFDRWAAPRLGTKKLTNLENLLLFSAIPWLLFGLVLFGVLGQGLFGTGTGYSSSPYVWAFPLTLLLVQGLYAFGAASYHPATKVAVAGTPVSSSRRSFIEKGVLGVLAVGAAIVSLTRWDSFLTGGIQPTGGSQPVDLQDAPAIFRDPRLTSLVDSEVTPNDNFYRVAIDIFDPSVDISSWSLMVDGMVGTPKKYALGDLQALPQTTEYNTFECVSNDINGNLIGNAKWTGVKLADLFADVGGVNDGAAYVVFYSVDGYSVGIPLARSQMSTSMVAYQMNDQTLPVEHGYPLRAVIPGLYGMMSAKWITRISVVGSVYSGYWQTRGWTNDAEVNTVAFVTTPSSGSQQSLSAYGGSVMVAGYAYAGDRGISKVEVSFDGGKTWETATLKNPLTTQTWALWAYDWRPQPGNYNILARATDGAGTVQTSSIAGNFPNGATGYVLVESVSVG